jgi:O-antigen/teichoic acid export membrane protein
MLASFTRIGTLGVVVAAHRITPEAILAAAIAADITLLILAASAARGAAGSTHDSRHTPAPNAVSDDRRSRSTLDLATGILRAAPWVNATQILMVLQSRLDWLLVAGFVSYQALANYALANKGLEFIVLGGSVFGKLALPWFVEGWRSRKIGSTLGTLLGLAIVAALVFAAAGGPFLTLVFGTKYIGAAKVIPIMAALAPALMLLPILQYAAQARGQSVSTAFAAGAGLLGQVGVDLLLIPRFGIIGAGIGMCAFGAIAVPLQLRLAATRGIIPPAQALRLGLASAAVPALLVFWSLVRS